MHPRWLRCSFFKYGPDILSRRALPSGRLASLGARRAFHYGLLEPDPAATLLCVEELTSGVRPGGARALAKVIANDAHGAIY